MVGTFIRVETWPQYKSLSPPGIFLLLLFFFFGCTTCRSPVPRSDQGSNLVHLQWKHRVPTTEAPGKSHLLLFLRQALILLHTQDALDFLLADSKCKHAAQTWPWRLLVWLLPALHSTCPTNPLLPRTASPPHETRDWLLWNKGKVTVPNGVSLKIQKHNKTKFPSFPWQLSWDYYPWRRRGSWGLCRTPIFHNWPLGCTSGQVGQVTRPQTSWGIECLDLQKDGGADSALFLLFNFLFILHVYFSDSLW